MLNNGELEIFFGATPNKGTYIIPDRQVNENIIKDIWGDAFIAYLEASAPHELLKVNTFKINDGFIDIEKKIYDYPYQGNNAYKISYLAVRILNKTLFYFVNSVNVMPQRIRLYVELDNWGTYIGGAQINNVRVLRTNQQIAEYNEIPYRLPELTHYNNTHKRLYSAFGLDNRINRNSLQIYAVIKHKTYATFSTAVEDIKIYWFDIRDIVGKSESEDLTRQDIRKACEWVASIYAVNSAAGGQGDAQLMHMYLYTNDLARMPDLSLNNYPFSGVIDATKKDVTGWQLPAKEYILDVVVGNNITYTPIVPQSSAVRNIQALGREVYFGTQQNGLKLPSFTGCLGCRFTIQSLEDRMLFKVEANGEERDITEAFEQVAVANTASLTATQATAKALGAMSNIAGGAFQIVKGGSGLVSGSLSIANTFTNLVNKNNGTYIGGGSAWLTFENILDNGEGEFLYFVVKDDNTIAPDDAIANLNKFGAECDYMITADKNFFEYINARPLLSRPLEPQLRDNIKMLQCSCEVSNIPYNAAKEIEAKFNEGVRLIAISANV